MPLHNPTTRIALEAAVEAHAEAVTDHHAGAKIPSTITGDKAPLPLVDIGETDLLQGDSVYDTTDVSSDSSTPEIPSRGCSAKITPPSRSDEGSILIGVHMILISFLFLLCSPTLLRRHYGEPLALLRTIALLISAYLFFWISEFSRTMRPSTILFGVLLSVAVDMFAGPNAVFAAMYLAIGWMAGLLGYAYAEHLQHIGRETAAKHIAPPSFLTEEERDSYMTHRNSVAGFFGLLTLLTAMFGVVLAKEATPPVMPVFSAFFSVLEGANIFCWTFFVAKFVLFDALITYNQMVLASMA
uniref:Uncharacterized protein n=1 Tax=Leersia perrieri TaxID=77586 RepID=A0A0D9V7J3_9ORYZ